MSASPADEAHSFWGREYPQYVISYTSEALSMLSISALGSHSPTTVSETIETICKLGNTSTDTPVDHIKLSMLTDLAYAIRNPRVLYSMAEPNLVSGCVHLMASVKPPALQYEHGYVCFHILVNSLSTCIMKHSDCLEETIARMANASAAHRLSIFWEALFWLIYQKSQRNDKVIFAELLDEPMLFRLLGLLYRDEKLFLIVLKHTSSLSLSGLMFVLFKYLLATKERYVSRVDHFEQVIQPYSRVFWRYLIVTPNSEAEDVAMFDLHARFSLYPRLHDAKPVDVEDSINLVQALNDRLESPRPVSAVILAAMLRFVVPLIVPGCENLIPTTIKCCIPIIWDFITSGCDAAYARQIVLSFLLYSRDILKVLKPSQFSNQPWIWEVADHFINGDVLDLALRVFSTVPHDGHDWNDMKGSGRQLFSATIEAYIAVSELVSSPDLTDRFSRAGCFDAWSKCYFYFRVSGTENTFWDTFSLPYSVNWACGEIIAGVMIVLMGSKWEGFIPTGSCGNPRCAMPYYASLVCADEMNMIYCSSNCAILNQNYPWGSSHRSVCQQQAQLPEVRKQCHQDMHLPAFRTFENIPSVEENDFCRKLIDYIKGKWSQPNAGTLQGTMVKGDYRYRKPIEFKAHEFSL